MTFSKTLYGIFFSITLISVLLLLFSWYKNYQFDNNPISNEIQKKVQEKKIQMIKLIRRHYNIYVNIPILITDKMNSKLFGMTVYDNKDSSIKIYLNKKRFKESINYMIDDVIAHEYAHALMFKKGEFSSKNSGHTLKWQKACLLLEGNRCDRFVNHKDILMDKTKLFY